MTRNTRFQNIRQWIGGRFLDFAEALPRAERGPIHHLQFIREYQREHSADPQRDPSPPPNTDLALSSIRLIEAYSIENFDRLQIGLQKLFPDLPSQATRSNLLAELGKSIRRLHAGGWWSVGILVREKKGLHYALPVRELPELPVQVQSVGIKAHHIMPSVAVLTFDAYLTDEASRELRNVQARPYLSEITFRSIFPWRFGHSERPVESVRQEHVRGWVDRFRSNIEDVLERSLEPGLFGACAKKRPRLPAVEIYLLSVGENGVISEEWEQRAHRWLASYGIDLNFDVYRSDQALFQWARKEHEARFISGHILTLFREKYLATIKNPEMYSGETTAILYHVENELDALLPVLVTLQALQQTRSVIEDLRERVFRRISARKPLLRLGTLQRLNAELLGQSMLLSRLKAEFSQQEEWISHQMKGWERFAFLPKTTDSDQDFRSATLGWINRQFETMEVHLRLARDAFGEYFTARNTRAVFFLTVAVVVLTVVQLLTNDDVWMWLTSLLRRAWDSVLSRQKFIGGF